MKKIVALVVTATFLLSQGPTTRVYANVVPTEDLKNLQTDSTSSQASEQTKEELKTSETESGNSQAQEQSNEELKTLETDNANSQTLEQPKVESDPSGTVYEEVKLPVPRSIATVADEREEFKLDRNGLSTITALTPLTSANYEVVLSYADKTVNKGTADTLQSAILKAQALINSDPNAIPAVLETQSGLIVYATEAVGRMVKVINGQIYFPVDKNTNVYSNSLLTNRYTYINHGYVDDVPILEDNGTSAKVEISGYTGWVNKDTKKADYDLMVVPLTRASNPSYYTSQNGELIHYISSNAVNPGSGYSIKLGPAPSFLQSGVKYYSYDGNYFYTSLKALISDGKANHHNNAVNGSNPYYNYYQYLPFRSKSTFTSNQINTYLETRANLTQTSKLRSIGQPIVDGQNANGVNALITYGVACNESGMGTSSISQQKNNIFGINAVDSDPAGSANAFASVADCINDFTKNYFSRDYGDPDDWKHVGAYLGNKNLGANVNYASDPFWGEKAAQHMYRMDYHTSNFVVTNAGANASTSNLKDFDNYQLAIYSKPSTVFSSPTSTGEKLYPVSQGVQTGAAKVGNVLVVNEKDLSRDGSTSYYRITPERCTIPWGVGGRFDGTFNWNKAAYVSSDSIRMINTGKTQNIPSITKKGWIYESGAWHYYEPTTGAMKTGWLLDGGSWYYLDSDGAMKTGWITYNGNRYYLDSSGARKTGWVTVNGSTYYLQGDGVMATGWTTINGSRYYLDSSGVKRTGWVNINGSTYYLPESGGMATGWVYTSNAWRYLDSNGVMKTGWSTVNGVTYYFSEDGAMATGWIYTSSTWRYLNSDGSMKTGWATINGVTYHFYTDGAMATGWLYTSGTWKYFDASGAMKTGWVTVGGYTYFFNADGTMATGWLYSGNKWYFLQPSGEMLTGWHYSSSNWYYFGQDGAMKTGWVLVSGKWYYLYSSGIMAYSTTIDGYRLGKDGARL